MNRRAIKGWPGYFVTARGEVFTTKSNSGAADKPPRPMKPQPNRTGHLRVRLSYHGKTKMAFVHTLVLTAFVGDCPKGLEGRHRDGRPANNRLDNLSWSTRRVNRLDMREHGTMPRGEGLHSSKLTEAKVVGMRRRFARGDILVRELAERNNVDPTTVGNVLRGKWWAHVGGPIVGDCRARGNKHHKRRLVG